MTKTEMLRQLAAAKYKPAEDTPPTTPQPAPATKEQVEALSKQIETLIRQRKGDDRKTTTSMDELAELAHQMGASLARLSNEYRDLLPRIMDEPKQQTAAMLQEVRAVIGEMKTAATSLSDAAQGVRQAARQVHGLRLKTWLGQVGTCLIVSAALLLGFLIWRPQLSREEVRAIFAEAILKAASDKQERGKQTEQGTPSGVRLKPSAVRGTKLESAAKPGEEKPSTEPTKQPEPLPEPPTWSTTNGAPPE